MSDSHANWLRRAADEIAKAGHYGWGNTCEDAAEHIDALEAELAALHIENDTLRAELESAHAAQRHAEKELSQYMAWYAMAEHQHLHEQRRAEKAEAERDALKAATSRCGLNFLTYNSSKGEPNEM